MAGVKASASQGNNAVLPNTADAPGVSGINIDETVDEYIAVIKCLDSCKIHPEYTGSI